MHQAVELPNNQFVSSTREFQRLAQGRSIRISARQSPGYGWPRHSALRPTAGIVAVFSVDRASSSRLPRPSGCRFDLLACVRWKRAGVALREWGEIDRSARMRPYSSSLKTSARLARSSSQVRPEGVNSQIPRARSSNSTYRIDPRFEHLPTGPELNAHGPELSSFMSRICFPRPPHLSGNSHLSVLLANCDP